MESRQNDVRMLHAAHASAYHWGRGAGVRAEESRAERVEWQVSRVYAVLGRGEPALRHAQSCLEICEQHPDNVEDWDLPFAYEALPRGQLLAGMEEESRRCEQKACELGE